jgi:hypothetical protein
LKTSVARANFGLGLLLPPLEYGLQKQGRCPRVERCDVRRVVIGALKNTRG